MAIVEPVAIPFLIDPSKLSNEYTPDDFASHRHIKLLHGHLDEEVFIELKFDFDQNLERQESVTVSYLNFQHTLPHNPPDQPTPQSP